MPVSLTDDIPDGLVSSARRKVDQVASVSRRVPKAYIADPASLGAIKINPAARANLKVDMLNGIVDKPKSRTG